MENEIENSETYPLIDIIPTELLLDIFERLSTRRLYACRRVCRRWKQIIDNFNDCTFWQTRCKKDHARSYKYARQKCCQSLSWLDLYRSLSLWSKLETARENWNYIRLYDYCISDLSVRDGVAGVRLANSIAKYDIDRVKAVDYIGIGTHEHLEENDNIIAFTTAANGKLLIVPKINGEPCFKSTKEIADKVYNFTVYFNNIYVVCRIGSFKLDVFICRQKYDYEPKFVKSVSMCHQLFIHVKSRLYFVVSDNLHKKFYKIGSNKISHLQYRPDLNYLCNIPVRSNYRRLNFDLSITRNDEFNRYRRFFGRIMLSQGDIIVTGGPKAILCIYNQRYLDLERPVPIKEYDLSIIFKDTKIRIISADIVEYGDHHTVLVYTQRKLLILELWHDHRDATSLLQHEGKK